MLASLRSTSSKFNGFGHLQSPSSLNSKDKKTSKVTPSTSPIEKENKPKKKIDPKTTHVVKVTRALIFIYFIYIITFFLINKLKTVHKVQRWQVDGME